MAKKDEMAKKTKIVAPSGDCAPMRAMIMLLGACTTPSPSVPIGQEQSGLVTYYDADGTGACSFNASPQDLDVAALNGEQYASAAYCGACAEVTGPKGSVRVRIVDLCPECKSGHLDLSKQAFAKVAELSAGRVEVKWKFVSCPVSGPLAFHFKDGSSQYWTAIQVLNHRLPITALEYASDGKWKSVARKDYNYFVAEQGMGAGDISVRVTASDGQQLVENLGRAGNNSTVQGKAQFR